MLDPTATYRTSQVVSASQVGQIVLLYQGAIRFAAQHLAFLEQGQIEQSHKASLRSQEIVAELRGSLDLSVGPIALQLDELYDFVQRRLVDGNMTKKPLPTEEAIQVLRGLLETWQELAARPVPAPAETLVRSSRPQVGAPVLTGAGTYAAGGGRR